MKRELKVLPPTMPNFFFYETPARPRGEGLQKGESYPITDFTKEEAEAYGELMKQTFIAHWESKTNLSRTKSNH